MTHEDLIRDAYSAGCDKRKNGANEGNCSFKFFATKEMSRAWSQGERGEELDIEIITVK